MEQGRPDVAAGLLQMSRHPGCAYRAYLYGMESFSSSFFSCDLLPTSGTGSSVATRSFREKLSPVRMLEIGTCSVEFGSVARPFSSLK